MTKVIEVYEEDTRQTKRGDNLSGSLNNISATILANQQNNGVVEVYEEETLRSEQ